MNNGIKTVGKHNNNFYKSFIRIVKHSLEISNYVVISKRKRNTYFMRTQYTFYKRAKQMMISSIKRAPKIISRLN